jgi:methionyl-tRNA formyltransferase
MDGKTTTGVTLQTMHHQHFDHGVILQQTPPPGLEIPDPDSCTVPQLLDVVTPKGADVLLDGVRQGLFVPPLENRGFSDLPLGDAPHAAKITPEDRHISWQEWPWQTINRRNRVVGPLWGKAYLTDSRPGLTSGSRKRLIFTEMEEAQPLEGCTEFASSPGWPFVASSLQTEGKREEKLYVWTSDKKLIHLRRMIVEGAPNTDAARAARKAGLLGDKVVRTDDFEFHCFHDTLS